MIMSEQDKVDFSYGIAHAKICDLYAYEQEVFTATQRKYKEAEPDVRKYLDAFIEKCRKHVEGFESISLEIEYWKECQSQYVYINTKEYNEYIGDFEHKEFTQQEIELAGECAEFLNKRDEEETEWD
jgi:hypothetical protein